MWPRAETLPSASASCFAHCSHGPQTPSWPRSPRGSQRWRRIRLVRPGAVLRAHSAGVARASARGLITANAFQCPRCVDPLGPLPPLTHPGPAQELMVAAIAAAVPRSSRRLQPATSRSLGVQLIVHCTPRGRRHFSHARAHRCRRPGPAAARQCLCGLAMLPAAAPCTRPERGESQHLTSSAHGCRGNPRRLQPATSRSLGVQQGVHCTPRGRSSFSHARARRCRRPGLVAVRLWLSRHDARPAAAACTRPERGESASISSAQPMNARRIRGDSSPPPAAVSECN